MDCFKNIVKENVSNTGFNIVILTLSIIISIIRIYRSYYIGQITQNRNNRDIFIFIGLVGLYYFFDIISQFLVNKNKTNFNKTFIKNVLKKIFNSNFEKLIPIKDNIISNLNLSLNDIDILYDDLYLYYIPNIISILASIVIFSYYIPKISFIIISIMIIILIIFFVLIKNLNVLWNEYIKEYNKFNDKFQNIILNMWNVKYNSLDNNMYKQLINNYNKRSDLCTKYTNYKIIITNIPSILFFSIFIINIFYIIKNKNFKVGIIVFLIFQLYKIWRSFDILCINCMHLLNNVKNINKICPVWFLDNLKSSNNKLINKINSIKFENVKYSYIANKNKIVIKDLNFTINKGEITYINGKSGKGKSTVINLICRLFDAKEGCIYINNDKIKDINLKSLKKEISVVPQNIIVFNNSIAQNIILDNKYNKSNLNKLIKLLQLPNPNTNALALSYGQKQRVLIGRTLYNTNKSVYIFDEYLSSIDKNTATKIHNYVIDFIKKNNKIGIFISHNENEKIYYDKLIEI